MGPVSADCPLCNTPTERVLTHVLRRGTGVVFHCEVCDLGFLVGEKVDPKEFYACDYRRTASHRAAGGTTHPQELFDVYSRYQAGRLDAVLPRLSKDSTVLEIGASAGQFLFHLEGKCARRCAIELDKSCCDFMTGMGIEADHNFLVESRFAGDKFDVVVAFQTMEHVEHPRAFVDDIRSVLKPGGTAFIEVPNLYDGLRSVWAIPEYEKFYFHSDHPFYFSAASLKMIARGAGFKKPTVRFTQDYNLLSVINWFTSRGPLPDCHVGLSPIKFEGENIRMAHWLSSELSHLNDLYIEKLASIGATSTLMMILNKE